MVVDLEAPAGVAAEPILRIEVLGKKFKLREERIHTDL
jgi:hypothetical protein